MTFVLKDFKNFCASDRNKCLRREHHKNKFYSSYSIAQYFKGSNSATIKKILVRVKSGKFPQDKVMELSNYDKGLDKVPSGSPKTVMFIHETLIHHLEPSKNFGIAFNSQKEFEVAVSKSLSDCRDFVSSRRLSNHLNIRYSVISIWVRKNNIRYKEISIDHNRGMDLLIPLELFVSLFSVEKSAPFKSDSYINTLRESGEKSLLNKSYEKVKVKRDDVPNPDSGVGNEWSYKSMDMAQKYNNDMRIITVEDAPIIGAILKPHIGHPPLVTQADAFHHVTNVKGVDVDGNDVCVPAIFLSHQAEKIVRAYMQSWLDVPQRAPDVIESEKF